MKKSLFYLMIPLGFIAFSCEPEETEPLTTDEAIVEMESVAATLSDDILDMVNTEGVEALTDLTNLADPFGEQGNDPVQRTFSEFDIEESRELVKQRIHALRNIFTPEAVAERIKDEHFVFEDHIGIYTYNFEFDSWDYTNGGIDYIQINFPSAGAGENNAQLNIYDYQDEAFETDEFGYLEVYYEPTALDANLLVNGNEVASVDFTASYNEEADPVTVNLALNLLPFTYALTFYDAGSNTSSVSASVSRGDRVIMGAGVDVTYAGPLKLVVNEISGDVTILSVSVDATLDVAGLTSAQEGDDINDFYTAEVFVDGEKVGDIEIDIEEEKIYIVFLDGQRKDAEDVFSAFITELEQIIADLENDLGSTVQ